LISDWLHGTRSASSCCVKPDASKSEVVFWVSMRRLSRTRYHMSITNAIKIYITFVIMKNLAERFAWARTESGLTQQELSKRSGVAQSTIASWESGARATGRKMHTVAAHLGVDPIWLAEGIGEAKAEAGQPPPPDLSTYPGARPVNIGEPREEMFPVRHVKIRIQAGFPMFEQDPDFDEVDSIDMPRALIDKFQLIPHCLAAIRVKGDSMEPMMFDGESIVINTADVKPVTGGVYAVNYDHMPSVKQLVYEAGDWWMYSFNPAHKKVRCRSAEFSVIGKLVYQPGRSLIGKL